MRQILIILLLFTFTISYTQSIDVYSYIGAKGYNLGTYYNSGVDLGVGVLIQSEYEESTQWVVKAQAGFNSVYVQSLGEDYNGFNFKGGLGIQTQDHLLSGLINFNYISNSNNVGTDAVGMEFNIMLRIPINNNLSVFGDGYLGVYTAPFVEESDIPYIGGNIGVSYNIKRKSIDKPKQFY